MGGSAECAVLGCVLDRFGGTVFCEKHAIAWAHSPEYRRVSLVAGLFTDKALAQVATNLADFARRIEREANALTWDERKHRVQAGRIEELVLDEEALRVRYALSTKK